VFLPEALLDGVKLTGHAETFDGRYFMSVGHDGEHGA
jgi:hypothetical protein